MQAQLEDMLKQMGAAASSDAGQASADTPSSGAPPARSGSGGRTDADADASFQETIRRTMERMQTSGDQATAAAASGGADDFMAEMLKQMSSGDFGGADGNDEDFSKMLMGMMEQLTNKDILYEPMKELDDKFPDWIAKNRDATPAEDMKRYEEQRAIVREIVAKFEEAAYADSNSADREFIVDRMAKVRPAPTRRPRGPEPPPPSTHLTEPDASGWLAAFRLGRRHVVRARGLQCARRAVQSSMTKSSSIKIPWRVYTRNPDEQAARDTSGLSHARV